MYEFAVTPAVTQIRRRGVEISEVAAGSLGAELELEAGDRIMRVNGRVVRDYLDFRFHAGGETDLVIDVRKRTGQDWELNIERDEAEDFGLSFEQIVPRQCANECIFCFCKGNPETARPSLFVRDEDVRLSFLYGNYTTLTSITEDEMRRVIEQRLSPQYVSVHATDLDVRAYLLGVDKARADINAIRAANVPSTIAGAPDNPRAAESENPQPVGSTGTANPIKKMLGGDQTREVTIPAGTVLPVDLETSVGSDISRAEQPVRGALRRAVVVHGMQVLPAGTPVYGHVTAARRPGKVKGRGLIAMRFNEIDTPGPGGRERMTTATVSRMAPATKQKDALEILAPAAGGAVIGRVVGGKKGAAEGALIGGGAGTAYVLTTRGKEIRLSKGANLSVRLTQPLTVRVSSK